MRDYCLALYCYRHIPILLHVHGGKYLDRTPNTLLGSFVRGLLALSNRVILLSARERTLFTSVYGDAIQSRISILHNFVSFEEAPSHKLLRTPEKQKLRAVFVGRLEEEKGLTTIVEALCKSPQLCNSIELDVYGAGSRGAWFCGRMSELLGSNFQYQGVVPRKQVRQSLSQYDVLLMPSLFGEGLPMALLEAMAAGCVPLVSALASVPLVVQANATGILLNPGSSEDLRDKLAWAVRNPGQLAQMSEKGARFVRQSYGAPNFERSLLAIYRSVVAERRPIPPSRGLTGRLRNLQGRS